ncbi:dTDP-4-dehydrorhamnose reductase [Methylovirgula sp. 4M-Z18]|nr:dTDP-4-dehydrorhamnose reductase [Methylovirgula sp. 4M-Z18]
MPLVVLGAHGQVGREVMDLCLRQDRAARFYDRATCDVANVAALHAAIAESSCVINCAAYTAVDKAESETAEAHRINGEAPGLIAQVCCIHAVPLLHLSTDYVFDGSGSRPWREEDPIAPQNVYGRSKAEGEARIRAVLPQHIILRTSWVFGAHGQNFVKTMRRLAATRPEISVVSDQRGGPTPAAAIAAALATIADTVAARDDLYGTYHFAGAPAVSWYEFAKVILASLQGVRIVPIDSAHYPTPAKRPLNAVLDCHKVHAAFGIEQPDWRTALAAFPDASPV